MQSSILMSYLSKNPDFVKKNIESFIQELKDIGSKNPILIAQGNSSFNILNKYLKDKFKIYKVTHYSAFISKEKLRDEYQKILKIILKQNKN